MNSLKISKPIMAFILAITGVVFFSSKAVMVKMAYNYQVDALSLLSLRLLFALPFYIGVFVATAKPDKLKAFKPKEYLFVVLLGFIGYYMASFLDFKGLNFISASLERLILFIYPTIVLIISALFLKKKATIEQKIAVFITYFGVVLAFYKNGNVTGSNLALGSFLIFGSALLYAIYLVGSGTLLPRFGTRLFTSMAMTVSTVAAFVHFALAGQIDLWSFPREVYTIALLMAVVCTVIPSFLIAESIRLIGASNVAVIGSFGPISTIILASIFLGERITVFQMLGTVIVISGVLLIANGNNKSISRAVLKKNT